MTSKRTRFGRGQAEHDNAHQLGSLRTGTGIGLEQKEQNDAGAGIDLGDSVLPPGEKLLVV